MSQSFFNASYKAKISLSPPRFLAVICSIVILRVLMVFSYEALFLSIVSLNSMILKSFCFLSSSISLWSKDSVALSSLILYLISWACLSWISTYFKWCSLDLASIYIEWELTRSLLIVLNSWSFCSYSFLYFSISSLWSLRTLCMSRRCLSKAALISMSLPRS